MPPSVTLRPPGDRPTPRDAACVIAADAPEQEVISVVLSHSGMMKSICQQHFVRRVYRALALGGMWFSSAAALGEMKAAGRGGRHSRAEAPEVASAVAGTEK
jgi:hypothetical protein